MKKLVVLSGAGMSARVELIHFATQEVCGSSIR